MGHLPRIRTASAAGGAAGVRPKTEQIVPMASRSRGLLFWPRRFGAAPPEGLLTSLTGLVRPQLDKPIEGGAECLRLPRLTKSKRWLAIRLPLTPLPFRRCLTRRRWPFGRTPRLCSTEHHGARRNLLSMPWLGAAVAVSFGGRGGTRLKGARIRGV